MSKSTTSARRNKPKKPYPDFPLFPHATGRWTKKICQKFHYFGKVADDPDGRKAVEQLNREWAYLKDARTPPPVDTGDGCTLRTLCNAFLTSKKNRLESGELSRQSFADYYNTCDRLIEYIGRDRRVDDLPPDDFEGFRKSMAKCFGSVTLKNEINRFRIVLKFAHDQRLVKERVNCGQSLNKPSAKMLRKARNEAGPRMFEAHEIRTLLDSADTVLKAMVLLGINCGFGNSNVASFPQSAVDLKTGWCDFPRPKTEINRRIPLWPETAKALQDAIAERPQQPTNKADADLCFLTIQGNQWVGFGCNPARATQTSL